MTSPEMSWLQACIDVPIECTQCGALTTIGGLPDDDSPDLDADLCGCDAEYRVYVADAPAHVRPKLAMLIDLLDYGLTNASDGSTLVDERQANIDLTEEDLRDD